MWLIIDIKIADSYICYFLEKKSYNNPPQFLIIIYSININNTHAIANIHCINHACITIVVSLIHLYSNKWWKGATANSLKIYVYIIMAKFWNKKSRAKDKFNIQKLYYIIYLI